MIGKKIERLQAKKNISNKELAKRMGINPVTIPKFKQRSVRPTTIHRIAKAFGVPADYFFDE
jgi:transcriptional regulator with XRE-family HTH domain